MYNYIYGLILLCDYHGAHFSYQSVVLLAAGRQFTVQNFDQLYVLVSSAHKTTRRAMTYIVFKATLKPKFEETIPFIRFTPRLEVLPRGTTASQHASYLLRFDVSKMYNPHGH